jgi:hypothetical protein
VLVAALATVAANQSFGRSNDDWQDRIIYFALLDRFENGNPDNDKAHGDPAIWPG